MGMKFYTTGPDYPTAVTLTLDQGTEHASYDLDNLGTRVRRKQFRTANGSNTDVYIEYDFGSAKTFTGVILDGQTSATSLKVLVGDPDNGAVYALEKISSDPTLDTEGIYYEAFSTATKRYWQIQINAFAANAVDWVNNIWLVNEYETPLNSNMPVQIGYTYDNVFRLNTVQYERRYKISDRRRVIRGINMKHFTETQMNTFVAEFEDNCQGVLKPFYFLDDDGSTYFFGSFIDQEFVFQKESHDNYNLTFGIMEQL